MEMKQMHLVRLRKEGGKHLPSVTSVFNFSSITLKCLNSVYSKSKNNVLLVLQTKQISDQ